MDQPPISINARQWSASVLEVDPNCETADLLGRLTGDEYVVSGEWADAMQVLANPGASSLPANAILLATQAGARQRVEVAVAGFANSFFEIPPYRRQEQWQALHSDCKPFPDLTRWLNNLLPAMRIQRVPETGDEAIDTFATLCCQSYVARGPERARRRQLLIHAYCRKPASWQSAVKHLLDHHRDFVTTLVPWLPKLQGFYFSELVEKNDPLPVPIAVTAKQPAKSEGNWWVWFVVLSIGSGVLRGLVSNQGSSSSNYERPIINHSMSPEVERGLHEIFHGKRENEKTDQESLRLGVKAMNEYMRRKYGSNNNAVNEVRDDVDDQPADALMPDQAPSDE